MLELNKIYNGESSDVLKNIDSESIDICVTSPPYSNIRDYQGFSFDFGKIAFELTRTLKTGGVICWIVNDQYINGSRNLESFKQAIFFKEECRLNVHDSMIYQKRNFSNPSSNRYHQIYEFVFIFSKGKPKVFNPIMDRKNICCGQSNFGVNSVTQVDGSKLIRKKSINKEFGMRYNIWEGKTRAQEEVCEKFKHPALAPKWLCGDLIKSWSNEGDLVLDPFAGGGTTLIEAKKLNRNFIGIEISQEYCKLIEENLCK